MPHEPLDPFAGDPEDPTAMLPPPADDEFVDEPLTPIEREEIVTDLADLEGFRALLEPRNVLGLVIECEDCGERHYMDWDLVAGNLRSLLAVGRTRVHEPAFRPDPTRYVSWEYARGYADAVLEAAEEAGEAANDEQTRSDGRS